MTLVAAPISAQVVEELRSRIRAGVWRAGEPLTPERRLAEQLGVCRATLRRTLTELRREGLIESRPPRGWFVATPAARKRTMTIGLLLDDITLMTSARPARTATGVQQVLAGRGYHLNIVARNPQPGHARVVRSNPNAWRDAIDPQRMDGLLVASAEVSGESVRELARRLPVIRLDAHTAPPDVIGYMQDFTGDMFKAARHLLDLGHRRLALVTVGDHSAQGQNQFDGARLAVSTVPGATLDTIRAVRNMTGEWVDAFARLMTSSARPTAVLCGSDDLARFALGALRRLSLRVPRDVSVVGWNDALSEDETGVEMTCVCPAYQEIARVATLRLLDVISQGPPVPAELATQFVPGELIIRKSTAAPSASM